MEDSIIKKYGLKVFKKERFTLWVFGGQVWATFKKSHKYDTGFAYLWGPESSLDSIIKSHS